MIAESWRKIAACDGYEVSDLGNVRCAATRVHVPQGARDGYRIVNLSGKCF